MSEGFLNYIGGIFGLRPCFMYLGYLGDRVIDAVGRKASNLLLDMLTKLMLWCLQSESEESSHRL